MIPEGPLLFTAPQAARQQAILTAEVAAGWLEPPPEEWQLADPDDADFCPAEPAGQPGGQGAAEPTALAGGPRGDVPREPDGDALSGPAAGAGQGGPVAPGAATGAGAGPDVAEAVPCGITHEAAGPGGRGFASGSVLDTLAPGPVLTGALEDATSGGGALADLPEDDLAGVILAWRRTESHALAGLLDAVAELHRRRLAHPDPRVAEHADSELAILMTMTGRAAIGLLDQATALGRLPATMAALSAGQIDRTRAAVLAFETELLDDTLAAAVELLVIEDAPGQTSAELRQRLRRAIMAADPSAIRRRKEKAAKDARVELQSEQSGNAHLAGRELPPAAAIAADARIDAAARALKAGGVKARLTQLRAAVFLSLLTGAEPLQFLPPPDSGPDSPAGPTGPPSPDPGPDHPASGHGTATPAPGGADTTHTNAPDQSGMATKPHPLREPRSSDEPGPGLPARQSPATKVTGPDQPSSSDEPDTADKPRSSAGPGLPAKQGPATAPAYPDQSRSPDGPDTADKPRPSTGPSFSTRQDPSAGAACPDQPCSPDGLGPADEPHFPGESGGELAIPGSVHLTVPLDVWLKLMESPDFGLTDDDDSGELDDWDVGTPGCGFPAINDPDQASHGPRLRGPPPPEMP